LLSSLFEGGDKLSPPCCKCSCKVFLIKIGRAQGRYNLYPPFLLQTAADWSFPLFR